MVVDVLREFGGAASWRRLRRAGVSWYALRLALESGSVLRLRRGVYAVAGADPAVCAVLQLGGVLACASAATALGLPLLFEPRSLHVIVPRRWSHARMAGVAVHRRDLRPEDCVGITTSLLRTVVDCARELPLREAVVICDTALRRGLDLQALCAAAQAARGHGAAQVRRVVELADARAESPLESCLRLLVTELAASVRAQVWINGVGRVDLLLDGWLVIEADGFEFHSSRSSYREDRRRTNALVAAGYEVLRFGYEDIVHRPELVIDTVRRVLERGARSFPCTTVTTN